MFNYDFSLTEDNNSTIPENMTFETEERLSTFKICSDDIVKFIRTLILNKAHGHDDMSIRTKKTCVSPISNHRQFSLGIVLRMNVSLNNGRKLK